MIQNAAGRGLSLQSLYLVAKLSPAELSATSGPAMGLSALSPLLALNRAGLRLALNERDELGEYHSSPVFASYVAARSFDSAQGAAAEEGGGKERGDYCSPQKEGIQMGSKESCVAR